ncbi:Y-box-binding protein 2-B-like [Teleopsis dalmanni]|uniref:Y-box-binding protein 2-B-like n=1 Tax=Teleopsis dalmanni TaxID=139649 RepID=UPI0018CE0B72|nr:Y-box-binding protein 2-B-like [Teleopsis dalmanni]
MEMEMKIEMPDTVKQELPTEQVDSKSPEKSSKITGFVKWFNAKKGFGFIKRKDTNEDVFMHHSAIMKDDSKKLVRFIADDEELHFDVITDARGSRAENITGPTGQPVRGGQFSGNRYRNGRTLSRLQLIKSPNTKNIIAERVIGIVKWYNIKIRYGFIHRCDTNEEVFAHQNGIYKYNRKKMVRSLGDGEIVEFDVISGTKDNVAINITGPAGVPVRGSSFIVNKSDFYRIGTLNQRGFNGAAGNQQNNNKKIVNK